ncbi:MAG TPA: trypsin-like peptidase domain-containing protein [Pirellulaceae bacterium]|nr:trypsin-like peptidase domain-containing protein [Pirellulaceae bacterium]HMO90781.1 trypsin-like peptidase domain-containing protein [Pirellulaceae bacterium]HMP68032.1 trypsin-like peptidase domain-containing protein [Pirellulaceae bacterium]
MLNDAFKSLLPLVVLLAVVASTTSVAAQPMNRDVLYEELRSEADLLNQHYGLLKKVVRVVEPTVVHIKAFREERNSSDRQLVSIEEAGAGAIFEYRGRHFVITNRHVIADSELSQSTVSLSSGKFVDRRRDRTASFEVRIQLKDGRFFYPNEIRMDQGSDLAILFIDEEQVEVAKFANSDEVELGDFVVAIGSPFGLNHSVSFGIVSAQGRRDLDLGSEGVVFQDFIQTDASINPGNSGGPLFNLRGEVIGINTAIASNSGGSDGIGFTIPANMVRRIVEDLVDYGYVRRGFLGVSLNPNYNHDTAKSLGLNTIYGAHVLKVNTNTPAEKAQILTGDVIMRFNGKRIENDSHLVNTVSMTAIGAEVPVEVFRRGEYKTLYVQIQERSR